MGDDSMTRAATEDELDAICELLETCLGHGAIGLSTSFVDMDEQLAACSEPIRRHEGARSTLRRAGATRKNSPGRS